MLTYDQLKQRAIAVGIPLSDLASRVGLTPQGFRLAIENETLTAKSVLPLCEALQLSLWQFYCYDTIINDVPAREIAQLRMQLTQKDEQIAKLINLLANR